MTRILRLALALLALAAAPIVAQEGPERDFGQQLFPPELVMQYQQKIGLRPEQRRAITEAIAQLQSRVVDLQWRMQEETQKLSELLQPARADEAEVLAQVDRVLAIEREVKRAHLAMLVRIKNALTPEQQAALKALR
jgi:Spy/CpxP family protein refolding chaperone